MAKKKPTAIQTARARRKVVFPAHLNSTPKEWRALKRQQWREVRQAIDRYNYGSAYTPAQASLWKLQASAHEITDAITDGDWVAW